MPYELSLAALKWVEAGVLASHTLARQTSPFKRHLDEQLKHFNFKPHRYTDFDLFQVHAVSYLPTLLETNIGAAYQDCGTSRVFFSFTDIETWALALNRQVDLKSKYDAIVAVARGGLYLGAMLSHFSGLPLAVVSYHRPSAAVHWSSPELNPGARVLLVEDIAGMGVTLVHCKQALQAQDHIVDVAVLAFDAMSRESPTFGINCAGHRVVFPWERGLIKLDNKVNAQGEYLDPWLDLIWTVCSFQMFQLSSTELTYQKRWPFEKSCNPTLPGLPSGLGSTNTQSLQAG